MPGRFPLPLLLASLAASLADATRAHGAGEPVGGITVDAGPHDRVDTPVSVALEGLDDPWRPLRLVEVRPDGPTPVPSQISPGRAPGASAGPGSVAGEAPRLWWIMSGPTPAGAKCVYGLLEGDPVAPPARRGAGSREGAVVELRADGVSLEVRCRGARVLRYNHGFVPPPAGVDRAYIKSGYMHPLWSPAGAVVTDDFPSDHYHHKGIWFPWTKTVFEGRPVDFWNLKKREGTVRFAGFESTASGPVFGGFRARHEHVVLSDADGAGRKVALVETWDVRVWNVGGPGKGGRAKGFWLWDLTSTQRCATGSALRLPRYRYGGLGFRGSAEWSGKSCRFLTSEGRTRKDGHATRARWCDVAGPVTLPGGGSDLSSDPGGDGRQRDAEVWAGVVVMSHPGNFRFPEPMRIHPTMPFFNFAPSQAGDWEIAPGKDHVFRYRFHVHDGKLDTLEAERLWRDFGEPPTASLKR